MNPLDCILNNSENNSKNKNIIHDKDIQKKIN